MLIFCSIDVILVAVFCFVFKSQNKFDFCFSLPSNKGASGQALGGAGGGSGSSILQEGPGASPPQPSRLQRPRGNDFLVQAGEKWSLPKEALGQLISAPCPVPVEKKMVFNCGIATCLENSFAIPVAGQSPISRELFSPPISVGDVIHSG